MGSYIPSTDGQRREMLDALGVTSIEQLYANIPQAMRLDSLPLPDGLSESETLAVMQGYAAQNRVFGTILRGAGAYDHYIPSIVKRVTAKEEFVTAYTPYQAEISQGILQSIFEYQTMLCELTGMDASNASVYDGATAAAEAAALCRDRKRQRTLISAAVHPMTMQTVKTYCHAAHAEVVVVPAKDGKTDLTALEALLCDTDASICFQQPSFLGMLEDAETIAALAHKAGAKVIMSVNPIAAALLPTPRDCGADLAVGDGQPLGMPLAFGGPYLGFMTATAELTRKLPGRIVGETTDDKGNRCFVLTLQAREQHIRREKASSNICSNQALCAMTAAVYLAAMGADGLADAARQCYDKAHYLAAELAKLPGVTLPNTGEFFHEFVTAVSGKETQLLEALSRENILGGLPVEGGILWCVTEKVSKARLDEVVATAKEVLAK
ncbi:MAG: aminomethyl-transferring glycine dehydrogenase subunit GcvPA [Angelakisella sp.]